MRRSVDDVANTEVNASNGDRRKSHCSICDKDVHDFTRHNREHHINHPGQLWICPHVGCTWDVYRDGTVTIDEHLVNSHQDFRHKKGHAGTLLWRFVADKGTLAHLTVPLVKEIARMSHGFIGHYVGRRDSALHGLAMRQLPDPGLAALPTSHVRWPLVALTKEFGFRRKADFYPYLMTIRVHFAIWDDLINVAEMMIHEADEEAFEDLEEGDPMDLD